MAEPAAARVDPPGPRLLVEARGLSLAYDGRAVLDRVDLHVHAGEIVTVVGRNGSGKSTLVRAILGLIRPDSGEVRLGAGLRLGYTPQVVPTDPTLPMTVARFLKLGGPMPAQRLEEALAEVGVGHLAGQQLARISGGELHRVVLARALLRDPELLVLDEPMSGIDVGGQADLYRLIARLRDRRGCGVLLVSHDLHVVMAATDVVVCLNHHVCCTGRPETVVRHPEFVSLFGRRTAEAVALYAHEHDHRHGPDGAVVPVAPERRDAAGR